MNILPKKYQLDLCEAEVVRHYDKYSENIETLFWYNSADIQNILHNEVHLHTKKFLDLCGGSGLSVETLSEKYNDVTFCVSDISKEMINQAKSKLIERSNVNFVCSNWIEDHLEDDVKYDTILLKNALHLIRGFEDKIDEIAKIASPFAKIVIVETVSPDRECEKFVRGLFHVLGLDQIKVNFFTEKTLARSLRNLNEWYVCFEKNRVVDQKINLRDWIIAKGCEDRYEKAIFYIFNYPNEEVLEKMNVSRNHPVTMLRRQMIKVLYKAS